MLLERGLHRVELDARAHRVGDRDLLNVSALGRRRPGAVYIVASFDDDDHVTDRDGRRWTVAEWEAAHPDALTIQLRWGDEGDDVALSHPIPADVWNNL